MFRVSHLLANHKCVVTEDGGCDPTLEHWAEKSGAMFYVPRRQIVELCRELVADVSLRRTQALLGYESFRKTSLADNVRIALEASL